MHSENFYLIKGYYDDGRWNIERVYNVVSKRHGITPEEFFEITGEPYIKEKKG